MKLICYVSGFCYGERDVGGYAFSAYRQLTDKWLSLTKTGCSDYTTTNRMYTTALVELVETADELTQFDIFTGSEYVISMYRRCFSLQKTDFRVNGDTLGNKDLWYRFIACIHKYHHIVNIGHADDKQSDRCTKLAQAEAYMLRRRICQI